MLGAKVGLLAYGGTHWAIVEARDQLRDEGVSMSYCRVRALPVSDEVIRFIERHQRIYVVEQNRDAQVTTLLKSILNGALADRLVPITHYNGTPIAAREHRPAHPQLGEEPLGTRMAHRERRTGQSSSRSRRGNLRRIIGFPIRLTRSVRLSSLTWTRSQAGTPDLHFDQGDSTMPSEATISVQSNGHTLTLPTLAFQGLPSTLCKGCGHNSITSQLIDACKSIGVNPYMTVKLSGIGCSSKTPAYFLQASHGFNALHGRMPSVATGALMANGRLLCIGISGDGDTANIGMGQFKHICRRNVPIVYIIEDNGCYGLTKGQFSATADLNAHLRRPTGEQNDIPPFDICEEAIVGGATFVARSFAGDKKQMVPLLKAALKHKGTSVLDIISPCVTFNDFDGSTKGWDWAKEHEHPLHDVGFVPRLPEIEVEQKPGQPTRVQLHDGSWITLKALRHEEHNVTDRLSALRLLEESQRNNEFLTGLIYVNAQRKDFVTLQNVPETPLALLPEEALRPSEDVLKKIMETI